MITKKKRLISLKNPQLSRIRTEMRNLLRSAFEDHYLRLFDQINSIRLDESLEHEVKKEKIQEIFLKSEELKRAFLHSVAGCRLCGRTDLDLIYNPVLNTWYCKGCYEFNREGHQDLYP